MEAHLSADKKVEQLSEEELHCVLKQLTDHQTPESEKCPLVQRLNAENAANDTSFSSLHQSPASVRNDANRSTAKLLSRMNVLSKDNEFQSSHRRNAPHSHCQEDKMNYAQSLQQQRQELNTANYCDDVTLKMNSAGSSGGGGGGCSNRKPNRANSFTMPFQSDNSDISHSNTSPPPANILDRHHLTNGGTVSPDKINNNDHVHFDTNIAKSSLSSSTQSSAPLASNSALASLPSTNSSHYSNGDKSGDQQQSDKNFSSVYLCSINSLVNSINSDNVPNYQPILSDNKGLARSNSRSLTVEEEEEEKIEFVEMKNLQRKANIIEYRSDMNLELKQKENDLNNKHCIDKVIDMPLISGNKPTDPYAQKHPDYISNGTSHSTNFSSNGYNSRCNSGNINGSTSAVPTNSSNNNRVREKKKRRTQTGVKLAEQIEGHIGYRDVSYLESFVNNTSSNLNTAVTNGFDKKNNKCKTQKPDNESVKRAAKNSDKRNNGENKSTNDKGMNVNKLSSSASNSSSLSGDDIATKTNTSPDPSNKIATKNRKPKRKQAKDNKNQNGKVLTNGNNINFVSDNNGQHCERTGHDDKCNQNSSSDDFEGTDAEYDDEEEAITFYCRSQKSNSLLQTVPVQLNDDEKNFYTVSDSEMADREKGFVTPKSKYFKKKRNQQSKRQRDNVFNSNKLNNQNIAANAEEVNHSLGRGYESERECSASNPNCIFTSQTFSSSMFTINPKLSDGTYTSQCNNQDSASNPADSNFLSNSDNDLTLCMATSDLQNSGPKIPSYADIAKSYNISPPFLSKPLVPIKSSEDFPQLNSKPYGEVIVSPTDSSKINSYTNVDGGNGETVACNKEQNDHKLETKSKDNKSKKEARCNSIISQSVTNKLPSNDIEMNSANPVSPESAPLTFEDGHVDITDVNDSINNGSYSPPVVIFGDNSLDICSSVFGDEAPVFEFKSDESSIANNSTRGKLVFGFFDDIDSEIFMLKQQDDDNCFEVNFTKDTELDNNVVDMMQADELSVCENVKLNFFKNAVHVNELEQVYFRKYDTGSISQDITSSTVESSLQRNKKYSSNSSTPSSFDSSLTFSSATVSSSSIQSTSNNLTSSNQLALNEPRQFISCASKIKNMKFIDNVDENSFNYVNIVGYVHRAWNICMSL